MAYLAYVRHGLSQANIDRITAGHLDTPLVDIGRQQAKDVAPLLKGITFHHVFGSPLKRAKETLEIILRELNLEVEPKYHDELKERNWGEIEGTDSGFYGTGKHPKELTSHWITWSGRPPGGESYEDMSSRIVPFFEKTILPRLKEGENVLIVSHNGISKPLQRYLEDIPHDQTHTLNLKNCEVKLYEFDQNGKIKSIRSRVPEGK